jgi:hypothetical protein
MADEKFKIKQAIAGLNLDNVPSQMKEGQLSYANNAIVENFDGKQVTYQNEQANIKCLDLPSGYFVIGNYTIPEDNKVILFLVSAESSEIGYFIQGECQYNTLINSTCLNFDREYPILDIRHKKNKCSTEVYWTDNLNPRRFIDLDNLPYKTVDDGCNVTVTDEVDCNKLNIQPNFNIPNIDYISVTSGGQLITGTYQFALQYGNSKGEAYTAFYSPTNPISVSGDRITEDFNYETDKAIQIEISNVDNSGIYTHINVIAIKTVNTISSYELVGTFDITGTTKTVLYTGNNKQAIQLSENDLFQKFPFYERAGGLSRIDDVLIWYDLSTEKRELYQKIANKIKLNWVTRRIPKSEGYKDSLNTALYRGYMRDEIYAFEIQFLLKNGKETDGFHIPGRIPIQSDLDIVTNDDIQDQTSECEDGSGNSHVPTIGSKPRWQVYNTGSVTGYEDSYQGTIDKDCYKGPYQYGEFGYWESTRNYPCNDEIWGELAGKPIRHHKFPDNLITYHHDEDNVYPIGVKIDKNQILDLLQDLLSAEERDKIIGFRILRGNRVGNKSVVAKGLLNNIGQYNKEGQDYYYPNYPFNDLRKDPFISFSPTGNDSGSNLDKRLDGFTTENSKRRFSFHSPDTHFYQPTLGTQLKLESVEYGLADSHFVQVDEHSKYKFLTGSAHGVSLGIGIAVALSRIMLGLSNQGPDLSAGLAAYGISLAIIEKLIPAKNFAYQFNSIGKYTEHTTIPNNGKKIRVLDLAVYLTSGLMSAGDDKIINNYQRESSIYLKTNKTLLFPHEYGGPEDQSRFRLGERGTCGHPNTILQSPINSYYGSIKKNLPDQYGDIYSYETISTGYQTLVDTEARYNPNEQYSYVFGGDIFISPFSFKNKLPFFLDNRVNNVDGSDVFYNELGNIGYPTYWFSTDYGGAGSNSGILSILDQIIGIKINNFDCVGNHFFYQDGKIYLFAYGIPTFYVESEVNVEYRQANNTKEGDFYPRVSSGIPDKWLQENYVSINFDNTYFYNRTFSKQNKELYISHIPEDYTIEKCREFFPNRAIYSEVDNPDTFNSWLIYRPVSFKDFPYSYGRLISIQSLENKAILTRFENRSKIYNALLVAQTNNPLGVYLGNDQMFTGPSLDFSDVNIGYNGTQHKLFIRTEYGHLSCDAERGQVFLISGTKAEPLGDLGLSSFFGEHLPFKISKYFPSINTDNNYLGIGLHGTYDNVYKRIILTKLDYEPKVSGMTYSNGKFYYGTTEINLNNTNYFCNKGWTLSFSFNTKSWISFHSYKPLFYVESSGNFLTGIENSIWEHNSTKVKYNNFYDAICPYILEYPFSFSVADEIAQAVIDYTTCLSYQADGDSYQEDDVYFNKAILSNNQQNSGVRNLIIKPKNNLQQYMSFPKYNTDSIDILLSKKDNRYQYNSFWNIQKDNKKPSFISSCEDIQRVLDTTNLDYSPRNFNKQPLRAKELKIRHILDNTDQYKLISNFLIHETQPSYA